MLKDKPLLVLGTILTGGVIVIVAMILFVGPLLASDSSKASECDNTNVEHTAVVQNGKITPSDIHAKKCDILTITNKDTASRLMAFGKHDKHIRYDGVSEKRLSPGQSFTVTLNQAGTYLFHDHYDESVSANFTVTE
jgi:hypothetical protein